MCNRVEEKEIIKKSFKIELRYGERKLDLFDTHSTHLKTLININTVKIAVFWYIFHSLSVRGVVLT